MRPSRKIIVSCIMLALLTLTALSAQAEAASFGVVPDVLRPGKYYEIIVNAPADGLIRLSLLNSMQEEVYTIFDEYPVTSGRNTLEWDGVRLTDHGVMESGDYTLRLTQDGGSFLDKPLRIGAPYPMITGLRQSNPVVHDDDPTTISFAASEPGTVEVKVVSLADGAEKTLAETAVSAGENSFQWRGMIDNQPVPYGEYRLILTLKTQYGNSMPQSLFVTVESLKKTEESVPQSTFIDATPAPTPEPTPEPTPTPLPSSPAYSTNGPEGTYWQMTPGEIDDAVIWEIMTQPITVYDGVEARDHAYLMENPDGTGKKVAQLHGKSQGVNVIGEVNEHGYVLVEAFSNYDRTYFPETDDERAHAFELKQGYVKANQLKTVEVQQDMGLLIDKLTQRMYLFIDGVRVTEFLISTGTWSKPTDMLFETVPGEFITVSHTGTLVDGNMNSAMAIRINGGILVHEVPHKLNADGSKNYSSFEAYLGTKQSHGCVRIQRKKTPEGYNQQWIWDNFKRATPYKVLIWDDVNRYDTPTTWQENPKN